MVSMVTFFPVKIKLSSLIPQYRADKACINWSRRPDYRLVREIKDVLYRPLNSLVPNLVMIGHQVRLLGANLSFVARQ
uniref:RKP n=1 Tax=Arundo donax TaxID=35708 RepID=A0A0A8YZX9_ARUDO